MAEAQSRLSLLRPLYQERGYLLNLHLDLTFRCPLRCPHCYIAGLEDKSKELTFPEVVKVLEEARDLKVLFLLISGGEPMVRPDFFDCLEAAHGMGFFIHVKTTGLYIGEEEARHFARLKPLKVDISIHGFRPETHDAFVGMVGAYGRAIKAVEALRAQGVRVEVRMNAVKENASEVPLVREHFEKLGVPFKAGYGLYSRRSGVPLEVEEVCGEALVEALSRRMPSDLPRPDPSRPICAAGITSLYIAADGTITPCALWPTPIGHVRNGGLKEALRSDLVKSIRLLRNRDRTECMSCKYAAYCPFCPGESVSQGLGPTRPNRLACRLAKASWRAARRGASEEDPVRD